MKPYPIPEPTENPVAALVIFYKVTKGIEYDNRVWDKIHFARCMKAAKDILMALESFETSKKCIEELSDRFNSNSLTWSLETIVKHAFDWKLEQGEKKNVKQAKSRFLHQLNEQRANGATSLNGTKTGPALLAPLRDFGIIQPDSGDEDRRRMEVRGGVGEGTRETDLEVPPARKDRASASQG